MNQYIRTNKPQNKNDLQKTALFISLRIIFRSCMLTSVEVDVVF